MALVVIPLEILEGKVEIVRDVLDKSVIDRNGEEMGRVDRRSATG